MGANFSNPFDQAARERCLEIIQTVCTTFTTEFLKSYKLGVIDKVKEKSAEANGGGGMKRARTKSFHIQSMGDGREYELVPPPLATDVIKMGTLTKRGDLKKSWLRRHFVALNAANNFEILYYTDAQDPAAFMPDEEGNVNPPKKGLKGRMTLAGYTVKPLENEPLGLLIEGNEAQRPWLLKAESAEDVTEWTPVFQRACKEAKPACDPDPVIHEAFMTAYKAVRHSQRLWGSWQVWGSEDEMLAGLVMDVLHERIMADIYDQIPKGPARNMIMKSVKAAVNGMVRAGVQAAYKAAIMSIKAVEKPVLSAAEKMLKPLLSQEPKITENVSGAVKDKITPPITTLTSSAAKKIFEVVVAPVASIYISALRGFAVVMASEIASLSPEEAKRKISTVRANVWGRNNKTSILQAGGAWAADEKLRGLAALDALSQILGGKTSASIAFTTTRSAAILCEKAIFDVEIQLKNGIGAKPAIQITSGKLVNDAQLTLETFFLEMLGGIILEPVQEQIQPVIEAPLEPIKSTIPEEITDFIDPVRIVNNILENILVDSLKAVVLPAMAQYNDELEKVASA